jgi:hypothetical protein
MIKITCDSCEKELSSYETISLPIEFIKIDEPSSTPVQFGVVRPNNQYEDYEFCQNCVNIGMNAIKTALIKK